MIDRDQEKPTAKTLSGQTEANAELPYWIDLWHVSTLTVERVLARAASAPLAHAAFKAALTENPGRRITVRMASKIISDSSSHKAID